jgi:predicted RNase H-like HicB family nuclease
MAASYSVTVGGKSYSGSVEESGGSYTASISNLPGATASGSSVQSAEDNLDAKLDALA